MIPENPFVLCKARSICRWGVLLKGICFSSDIPFPSLHSLPLVYSTPSCFLWPHTLCFHCSQNTCFGVSVPHSHGHFLIYTNSTFTLTRNLSPYEIYVLNKAGAGHLLQTPWVQSMCSAGDRPHQGPAPCLPCLHRNAQAACHDFNKNGQSG